MKATAPRVPLAPRAARTLALAALAALCPAAEAADRYWIVNGDGLFFAPANWGAAPTPPGGASTPVANDRAYIRPTAAATVTRDNNSLAINAPGLLQLEVDNLGGQGAFTVLKLTSNFLLTAANETVGNFGNARLLHQGGNHLVLGNLTLGASPTGYGEYVHDAGTPLSVSGTFFVGGAGSGAYTRTGTGSAAVTTLVVADQPNTTGSLSIPAGAFTVSGTASIGGQGAGSFAQAGGNVTVGAALLLATTANGTGAYSLAPGATLAVSGASGATIGQAGAGTFTQTGGTFTTTTFSLGQNALSAGAYDLSAGKLTATGLTAIGAGGNGTWTQSGGDATVGGVLTVAANATSVSTVSVSGGSLTANAGVVVGRDGNGSVYQSGGAVTSTNGGLAIANGAATGVGLYNLSADGRLTVDTEQVGRTGQGTFEQSGGVHTVTGNLSLATTAGSAGTFNLSGGSLTVGNELQLNPNSTFNQTGGALYAPTIRQQGGTITGVLQNQGNFIYTSGAFNGRLLNQGTLTLPANFTAGDGIQNEVTMTLPTGQTITSNGQGLANAGTFNLTGGTLAGTLAANDFGGVMNARGIVTAPFVNYGTLTTTGALNLAGGGVNYGLATVPAATSLRGGVIANDGGVITLVGGAITTPLDNLANGILQGGGSIAGPLANLQGGIVYANSPATPLVLFNFSGNSPGGHLKVADGSSMTVRNVWNNAGLITLEGDRATLGGGGSLLHNFGTIEGRGQLAVPFPENEGTLRALGGRLVVVAGPAAANAAAGQLQVAPGATLTFPQGLASNAGLIALSGGTFDNNAWPLANAGSVTFDAGANRFQSPLDNSATGKIILTNGATATFYYGVTSAAGAEIRVAANATAVFLAPVNGPATFNGTGAKYFEGGQSAAGPIAANGVTVIQGAATLTTDHVREASLTVNGHLAIRPNSLTSKVGALSIAPAGQLDLSNTAIAVDYAAATPLVAVRNAIATGALTSSALNASTAIGYAEASEVLTPTGGTFRGLAVDGTTVLARYTLSGDATLDGVVDFNDLVKLAQNYNTNVAATTDAWWSHADFTGDGVTDFNDLVKLAQNYNTALPSAAVPGAPAGFESDLAAAFAAVPEPATPALLLLAAAAALAAPRRRSSRRPALPV